MHERDRRRNKFSVWERFIVVVIVYYVLSRQLHLAFSANLGLLCMPHPDMEPLV